MSLEICEWWGSTVLIEYLKNLKVLSSFDLRSFQICKTDSLPGVWVILWKFKKHVHGWSVPFVGNDVCGANIKKFGHAHSKKPGRLGILMYYWAHYLFSGGFQSQCRSLAFSAPLERMLPERILLGRLRCRPTESGTSWSSPSLFFPPHITLLSRSTLGFSSVFIDPFHLPLPKLAWLNAL